MRSSQEMRLRQHIARLDDLCLFHYHHLHLDLIRCLSADRWSADRAERVCFARWPRWAPPGRRDPLQPSCCGDTRPLRLTTRPFDCILVYRKMAIRVVGVAIRGAQEIIALSPYRHIAISPLR
jgi:hypothetical protein